MLPYPNQDSYVPFSPWSHISIYNKTKDLMIYSYTFHRKAKTFFSTEELGTKEVKSFKTAELQVKNHILLLFHI